MPGACSIMRSGMSSVGRPCLARSAQEAQHVVLLERQPHVLLDQAGRNVRRTASAVRTAPGSLLAHGAERLGLLDRFAHGWAAVEGVRRVVRGVMGITLLVND
jgi:hypothetical protein